MRAVIHRRGERFGRLTVLRKAPSAGRICWECKCRCGNLATVSGKALRTGKTQSCGCLNREVLVAISTSHGHARKGRLTPEYQSWRGMLKRCTEQKNSHFRYYGGRGIAVCARWRHDFSAFLADMGPKPTPKHTIERRDNDGNYEPDNCCWATRAEQNKNKRAYGHG